MTARSASGMLLIFGERIPWKLRAAVRNELGDAKIHLAMIGAGGEHMVRYACIMEGCKDAGGRGGLGACHGF